MNLGYWWGREHKGSWHEVAVDRHDQYIVYIHENFKE